MPIVEQSVPTVQEPTSGSTTGADDVFAGLPATEPREDDGGSVSVTEQDAAATRATTIVTIRRMVPVVTSTGRIDLCVLYTGTSFTPVAVHA
jgi:hypothetical protein